jgi:hypothetical protein
MSFYGAGGKTVRNMAECAVFRRKIIFLQTPTCALSSRMSTPRLDKSSLPDPSYHWPTRKALAFLGALGVFGRVGEAARAVGMGRQSAYRLRARLGEDSVFAQTCDKMQAQGRERRQARRVRPKATPLPPERDIFGLGK